MPSPFLPRLKLDTRPQQHHITSFLQKFKKKKILQPLTFIMTQGCQSVNSLFDYLIVKEKQGVSSVIILFHFPFHTAMSLQLAGG